MDTVNYQKTYRTLPLPIGTLLILQLKRWEISVTEISALGHSQAVNTATKEPPRLSMLEAVSMLKNNEGLRVQKLALRLEWKACRVGNQSICIWIWTLFFLGSDFQHFPSSIFFFFWPIKWEWKCQPQGTVVESTGWCFINYKVLCHYGPIFPFVHSS